MSSDNSLEKRIWKYDLVMLDVQDLEMPRDADILSVSYQGPRLSLWALVYPSKPRVVRSIEIIGTGNPIPERSYRKFIGTVVHPTLPLVWHIFDLG